MVEQAVCSGQVAGSIPRLRLHLPLRSSPGWCSQPHVPNWRLLRCVQMPVRPRAGSANNGVGDEAASCGLKASIAPSGIAQIRNRFAFAWRRGCERKPRPRSSPSPHTRGWWPETVRGSSLRLKPVSRFSGSFGAAPFGSQYSQGPRSQACRHLQEGEAMTSLDFDALFAQADRLDFLCARVPICPSCSSVQVQLMDRGTPAGWRCRSCRHRFELEPVAAP